MKQNIYLKNKPLEEVEEIIRNIFIKPIQHEIISVYDALGRVTGKSVFAEVSSPCYNASAMDGVALIASDTEEATESNPVTLIKPNFNFINTGNIIEDRYNAVVMIEDIVDKTEDSITIIKSATPFQNIRPIGEDIVENTPILSKHHTIRPIDLSALISGGIQTLEVLKKPRIVIFPTGDEIIRDVKELKKGKIIDSNSYFLQNALLEIGADPIVSPVIKDDFSLLEKTIVDATKIYDMILIGAGSSAGTKDFAKSVVEKHGKVEVHGIAIKPGKPTLIGTINGTPIIGVPGYPVSTYITFELVVKPIVSRMTKKQLSTKTYVKAKLTKKLYSSLKHSEYVRVKLAKVNGELVASPLNRGAGITMSVVLADGLLIIPRNIEGFEVNETADVLLLSDLETIEKSLTIIGSHDILIDEMNDIMRQQDIPISSIHVGSFGGIMAIKTNECHLAPIHLLSEDGTYNDFVIPKYLNEDDFALIKGVGRIQGLYVKKGNPKNIKSIEDLKNGNLRFVNRQRGSGTRILLDYLLKDLNIESRFIEGYHYELPTHTMVATSVLDQRYDVGMGIESVANLYDLDFIKIGEERYDFIVSKLLLESIKIKKFIETMQNKQFINRLKEIGGYTFDDIGTIVSREKD